MTLPKKTHPMNLIKGSEFVMNKTPYVVTAIWRNDKKLTTIDFKEARLPYREFSMKAEEFILKTDGLFHEREIYHRPLITTNS